MTLPQIADEETAEAGRQVALYVTELETRRPLTVGEDYLVTKQRADDFAARQLAKWTDVLDKETTQASDSGEDLGKHVQKLLSKWKNFRDECLSEQQRKELTHDTPDLQSVGKVIQQLTVTYQKSQSDVSTNSGTVVRSLRRMGQGMHAHKTMLSIVPSGNNYAAIICGVVQTLIKASANHHRITDAIAREIAEINDHVYSCSTLLDLYPNERMQRLTVKLYCHIFTFFERVVQWLKSRWQRFRRSFSDDSMETLHELSTDIKRHIEALHRTADVGHKVEGRLTHLGIGELQRQVASQAEYLEKTWAVVNEMNSPKRQQEMMTQISVQMFHLLQGKDWLHTNVGLGPWLRGGDDISVCETIEDSHSPLLLPREEFARALSDNGNFTDEGFDPFDRSSVQPVHIDGEIAHSLQTWLTRPQPTFLWISGPATEEECMSRSVAQAFVRSAIQGGTPMLWHSCVLKEEDRNSQQEARIGAFDRLLRALIQQLVRLSRPTRPPSPSYSPGMVAQRPGPSTDLLDRFETLLHNSPPLLFCSIDDFQLLDDPAEDNSHLMAFLRVLRKYGDSCLMDSKQGQGPRIFKVLFTTSYQSWALSSELDPEEICSVAADDWRASLYPGEEAPGRMPLSLEPSISSLSL